MNLKNLLRVLFALTVFTLFVSASAFATTYYVDGVNGNDSWTGTSATFQSGNVGPKKTIQAMLGTAVTADVIEIAAATYNETVTLTNRVQLKPTGAIFVQDLILNTGSSTAVELGNNAGNQLTVTGRLAVITGNYNLANANQVVIGTGSTYEIYVGGASAAFATNDVSATAGAYTLKFLNTAALAYAALDIPSENPKDILFNGSAVVTLPAALTAQTGDLTIAAGASVNLNAFDITVQGGDFTNNGSYFGSAAEKVAMTSTVGTITGAGTFQNLSLDAGGTFVLGSNIAFNNVSQSVASLLDVTLGDVLDLKNFNVTTPGSVTISGGIAYSGAGATTPGTLTLTGDLGTIGTVTFTVPAGGLAVQNLAITKPSGSTVNLAGGDVTVAKLFNFTGGIFNLGVLNLSLANSHSGTAAIGGNINGSGNFVIGTGALANDIVISGAGQINTPFIVNAGTKTVSLTQLITVGNNLTLTSGNLTTSSLQLINGSVVLTAGVLTFNTSNLSVTNITTLNGGQLKGSSNITIAGALAQNNASIINMTGNLTAASYATAGPATGTFTAGTTTTTGAGAFNIGTATGVYTVNGNLSVGGAFTSNSGAVHVTGNASSGGAFTIGAGALTVDGSLTPSGAFSFAGASVLTVGGALNGGSTVDFTTAAATAAIAGDLSATGALTIGANAVTVGGNLTTTTAGGHLVGAAGNLTVTGVANVSGNITVGAGDIDFAGSGNHVVGGNLLTSAANAATALRFRGAVTVSGNPGIQPTHGQAWRFDGAVTLNNATAKNIDLDAVAGAFTVDFYGSVSANDLLTTGAQTTTVNFQEAAGVVSQLRNWTGIAGGDAAATVLTVGGATADGSKQHLLGFSGDLTPVNANAGLAVTVGVSGRIIMNGSGDLQTFANTQTITVPAAIALAIANLEVANTGTDSDLTANGGGNADNDERKDAVNVSLGAGATLTTTKLWLTSNGINGTNFTIAAGGTITRSEGAIYFALSAAGGVNLVYTNAADITTGIEYTVPAGGNALVSISLPATGAKVTLTAATGTMTAGSLTVAAGRELATATFAVTILTPAATGTYLTVNGAISGTGVVTYQATGVNTYTIAGTGTVNHLTVNFAAAGTVALNALSAISGNLITSGGIGTFNYGTAAPATIGGNLTINAGTVAINASPLTVTGNVTYTTGNTTLAGGLNVGGTFTQTGGNLTISANTPVTVTGNYTSTAGTVTFPVASTSSFVVKGATNSINGATVYTFGAGASGRVVFNGAVAQTLNLVGGANTTIDRFELNTPSGLNMSGVAVNLVTKNLKLTNGTFTHNGLLSMALATDRIIRVDGALASFPAAGPGEVEYASTNSYMTGFELVSTINKLVINAASGNPTFTLDKNVTILTNGGNGELNLSRGTLAIGSNSLIMQNNTKVFRAEGSISGTPTYGNPTILQYYNTESDLTTGPEFTNDGKITSLVINAPGRKVILGAAATVAGGAVDGTDDIQLLFGTLDLGASNFTFKGDFVNNGVVTSSTGRLVANGPSEIEGSSAIWPNIEMNSAGNTLNVKPADEADVTFGSFTLTDGNVTFNANPNNPKSVTINGDFTVAKDADDFADANITNSLTLKGNFTNRSNDLTITRTWIFNGSAAQTFYSVDEVPATPADYAVGSVTVNNAAGLNLLSNMIVDDGNTLTLTSGRVTTGAFYLQLGVSAVATATRPANGGMVVGNFYKWADTGVLATHLIPLGTATGQYRPVMLDFTAGVASPSIIKVTHTNSAPVGEIGMPITNGGVTVRSLSPLYWTVGIYDASDPTVLLAPTTNPKVTLGVGGYAYGDITKVRAVYRLTNPNNTWLIPGTFDGSFYSIDGVTTVIHSGVQGWQLEPQQLFTIAYSSNLVVANVIANQALIVGTNFVKNLNTAPAVFSGNVGTLGYTVTSSDSAVALPTVAAGVLTVAPVAAGTATITITATDVNSEVLTTSFNVTVTPLVTGVSVSGQVTYYNSASTPMSNVAVTLKQGAVTVKTATTDASGNFTFTGVAAGEYQLTGTSAKAWGGVNGTDALRLLQYTVGQQTFAPIQVSAANVNNDANVNATDALDILKRTVGQITSFGKGDWVVDSRTVTVAAANVTAQNLVALAVGDVDRSFVPTAAKKSSLVSFVNDGNLEVNLKSEMIELPIRVSGSANVAAMSLSFTYPKDMVEFVAVSSSAKGIVSKNVDGRVNLAWASLEAMNLKAGDAIVTLKFRPTSEFKVGKSVSVEVDNSVSEVADANGQAISIALKGAAIEAYVPKEFALAQNFPNPFNPATTINYELPVSGTVNLVVYNSIGEVVATLVNGVQEAGPYQVIFNASNLASGIYLYRIDVKGEKSFSKTNKMILMK